MEVSQVESSSIIDATRRAHEVGERKRNHTWAEIRTRCPPTLDERGGQFIYTQGTVPSSTRRCPLWQLTSYRRLLVDVSVCPSSYRLASFS